MEWSTSLRLLLFHVLILTTTAANIKQIIDQEEDLVQMRNIMNRMPLPISTLLASNGPFTMFVPVNEAFDEDRMPRAQWSTLTSSRGSNTEKERVNNQLLYHIINGIFRTSDLEDSTKSTKAINAPPLFIRGMSDGTYYVNGAKIIRTDINADNGVVHFIDAFLAVPEKPGDGLPLSVSARGYIETEGTQQSDLNLKTSKFNELLNTYKSEFPNKATNVLNNQQMTLFLPTDDSLADFTSNDIAEIKKDTTVLRTLVERHIIHTCSNPDTGECDKDNVYHTGILENMVSEENNPKIQAMEGQITPTLFNKELYIGNDCGGSKIVWGNITVKNGVIHMIDGFLGFRRRNVLSYLEYNNQFRKFYDLAFGAPDYIKSRLNMGSGSIDVQPDERVTVFAPIEIAMRDYDLSSGDERELHVRYHVMEGEMEVKDMTNGTARFMFPGDDSSDPRLRATFSQLENGDTYVTVDHVRARIIRPNVCVKNGLIHIVDNIMGVPLYTIYKYIEIEPELDSLYRQLSYTDYKRELDSQLENKLYTFFTPVNHAFELMQNTKVGRKYMDPLRIANKGPSVLYGRHITHGEIYINELPDRVNEVVTYATQTLGRGGNNFKIICNSGRPCYIEFEGGIMTFNQTNIKMINGVVHLINEVIYTDNEAREAELTAAAPVHHMSFILIVTITSVLLSIL